MKTKPGTAHCVWSEDIDGNWETTCKQMFVLDEGTPEDNGFRFCCYCGKALSEKRYANEV